LVSPRASRDVAIDRNHVIGEAAQFLSNVVYCGVRVDTGIHGNDLEETRTRDLLKIVERVVGSANRNLGLGFKVERGHDVRVELCSVLGRSASAFEVRSSVRTYFGQVEHSSIRNQVDEYFGFCSDYDGNVEDIVPSGESGLVSKMAEKQLEVCRGAVILSSQLLNRCGEDLDSCRGSIIKNCGVRECRRERNSCCNRICNNDDNFNLLILATYSQQGITCRISIGPRKESAAITPGALYTGKL
jgi:hypothetical protein